MTIRRTHEAVRGPIAFWALAGMGLFISHDAIFLIQIGPGEALAGALRQAGHGYWGVASAVLALVGLAAALAGLLRLRALRRRAAHLGVKPATIPASYLPRVLAAWGRLLLVVAIGFAIQENVEHLISHSHAPGMGALLGPEYPLALPVIALITGIGAILAATVGHTERALLVAIAHAQRRPLSRAPRRILRPSGRIAGVRAPILARAAAGRAPPALLFATG